MVWVPDRLESQNALQQCATEIHEKQTGHIVTESQFRYYWIGDWLSRSFRLASSAMADKPQPERPVRPPEGARIVYASAELFQGRKEIFIEHERELYTLRITSKDKLLLTK